MDLWRIGYCTNPAPEKSDLLKNLGLGSTMSHGRWHTRGSAMVVYCAESRSLATLEKRVHSNSFRPPNMALMRVTLPDDVVVLDAKTSYGLPVGWHLRQAITQAIGRKWLKDQASLAMWVPSAITTGDRNILINPAHPDYSRVTLEIEINPFEFDKRLFTTAA